MEEASDLRDGDTSTASRCAGKQCSREPAAKPVAPSVTPNQGCVVDIRAASLTAYSTEESIITNLTVSIDRHELVMVAGPVGCGKSTLLRSLIGDGVLLGGGFWRKPGACGYCDQEPWLQHASIQQNIIGRCPLDLEWYNAVLNACLLTQDLHNLTKGDRTIIGNNTSNLSHGQEHKVVCYFIFWMTRGITNFRDYRPWLVLFTCELHTWYWMAFSLRLIGILLAKYSLVFLARVAFWSCHPVLW